MISSFKILAKQIKARFNPKLTIEIGSNDGAFLFNFSKKKIIGVEPCKNLAILTKKKKYKTFDKYWDQQLAKKITKKRKADLIYSANTLSHIENLDEIFQAVNLALNKNGVLILEDPSLLSCLKNNAYDQFYCEHIYVFSIIALMNVLNRHKLEIFDIQNLITHGGSNRYFIKKIDNKQIKKRKKVKIEINKEKKYGLNKLSTFKKFAVRVKESKKKLKSILKNLNLNKKKVVGYGATAKSCTVLNFCEIGPKEISYFLDTTPDKINKYLPGSKIFVKKYEKLKKEKVDVVFLGAWNFKDEIFKKEKLFIKKGGKFLTHVPKVRLI
jgi:methylation protein EvaC